MRTVLRCLIPFVAIACAPPVRQAPSAASGPPAFMLGTFADDYGDTFTVSSEQFVQRPRNRFRIARWDTAGQYFIAQNDSTNASARNRWTRVDWVRLTDMAPYTWAFCFSAFDAPSEREAEATTIARRETPRTGCNGYPFTRMKPTNE